jgi:hypothetical protein
VERGLQHHFQIEQIGRFRAGHAAPEFYKLGECHGGRGRKEVGIAAIRTCPPIHTAICRLARRLEFIGEKTLEGRIELTPAPQVLDMHEMPLRRQFSCRLANVNDGRSLDDSAIAPGRSPLGRKD